MGSHDTLVGSARAVASLADEVVHVETTGHVMTITINRTHKRNSFDGEVLQQLGDAFSTLDKDPSLRVAVLTGAGGTFSSGMDLAWFSGGGELDIELFRSGLPVTPVIAAVEGYALAGGLELALFCDMIVAAEDVKLGIPEVKRGLFAAAGGVVRLPRRLPRNVAMEMALTGEPIGARRAAELGLVNRVCAPGEALNAAYELAAVLIANSPTAVRASKRLIECAGEGSEDAAWERSEAERGTVFSGPDAAEGPRAFVEKRPPQWAD